jgi:hypothetical protein
MLVKFFKAFFVQRPTAVPIPTAEESIIIAKIIRALSPVTKDDAAMYDQRLTPAKNVPIPTNDHNVPNNPLLIFKVSFPVFSISCPLLSNFF